MSEADIEKNKRREKVKHVFEALPPFEAVRNIREADDLPRSSLYLALDRYVQGIEADSIFHSAFSVEMALILRLDKCLTAEEKEDIRQDTVRNKTRLMFGKIIGMAEKKSIVKDADASKA